MIRCKVSSFLGDGEVGLVSSDSMISEHATIFIVFSPSRYILSDTKIETMSKPSTLINKKYRDTGMQYWLLLLMMVLFASCNQEITDGQLDQWVRDNDATSIHKHLYIKSKKFDKAKLDNLVDMYAKEINENKLISKPYVDKSIKKAFTGKERKGYEYYDEEGNLHFSITYVEVVINEEGTKKYNFIDFRSTDGTLPCTKLPIYAPVRCIYKSGGDFLTTLNKQSNIDSLRQIGPKDIYGYEMHHYDVVRADNSKLDKDSIKSTIVFNINNKWLVRNFDIIFRDLATRVNLTQYNLAYIEDISTPKFRIWFDSGFNPEDMKEILDYLVEKLDKKLFVTPSFEKDFKPFTGDLILGHAETPKIKIGYGR